jgi:hypothetical protein
MNSQACHRTAVSGNNGNMMQTQWDNHGIEPEIDEKYNDIPQGEVPIPAKDVPNIPQSTLQLSSR